MTGASIETTLALWASSLRDVKRRMRSLFAQERTAANAGLFIDGLLGEERRKTGWMRAEAAGDPGPSCVMQRVTRSRSRPRLKMPERERRDSGWLKVCCSESERDWRPGREWTGTFEPVAAI
jgi:hypothetical protein